LRIANKCAARAELHQRDMIGTALQVRHQRRHAAIQERVLGAGQIIFGQFSDALEKAATFLVVEQPRGPCFFVHCHTWVRGRHPLG